MTHPRPKLDPDRGWHRSIPTRGADLLNAHWHELQGISPARPCPICGQNTHTNDHLIHHGGELYHPGCSHHTTPMRRP